MNKEEKKIIEETAWGKNVETKAEKKERKRKNRKEVIKNLKENAKKFGEGVNKLAESLAPKEEGKKVNISEQLFGETDVSKQLVGEGSFKYDLGI